VDSVPVGGTILGRWLTVAVLPSLLMRARLRRWLVVCWFILPRILRQLVPPVLVASPGTAILKYSYRTASLLAVDDIRMGGGAGKASVKI